MSVRPSAIPVRGGVPSRTRSRLGLERLLDRVEGDLAADLVPSGGDPESGRLVEAVGSREPQLHGAADMVEADVLPVCRVVREEVPADRDPRSVGQAAREEDGPGRARRRLPSVRPVDRDKVAGDRPDHRQLVDDAAQQRPAVQVTEGGGGRSDGRSDEAVCRRPDRADDLPIDVGGRRSQVSEAELRLTGRMEHGDLDRAALAEARTRIGDDPPSLHDGRVEDLHVPQQQPIRVRRRRQPVRLGHGVGERLLAQDRDVAIQRCQGRRPVGAGRQQDQPVDRRLVEQPLDRVEPGVRPDVVALAEGVPEPG